MGKHFKDSGLKNFFFAFCICKFASTDFTYVMLYASILGTGRLFGGNMDTHMRMLLKTDFQISIVMFVVTGAVYYIFAILL